MWAFVILAISVKLIAFLVVYLSFKVFSTALLDSTLFLILVLPLLYFFVFKPMANYLRERDRFEKNLMESQYQLNSFYQSGLIGVYYWNGEGEIFDANFKFLDMTGYTLDDLKNGHILWSHLSPAEYYEIDQKAFNEILQHGSNKIPFERKMVKKDGGTIWVETATALLEREKLVGVSFVLDIDERKKNEEFRKNYSLQLEEMVKVRTAELEASKEKAESADRLKSAFLANISHEFRTPLNSIIGFSGILLMGKAGSLTNEQQKQIQMIKNSGQHLLGILSGILDLSELQAGKIPFHFEVFNILEVIENIIERESGSANEKGLILEFEKKWPDLHLYSDRGKIDQVLLSLINNAIKFTNSGSVKVRCDKEEDCIKIEVSDTGIGIRPEQLSNLFQPFIKTEDYLVRQSSGCGLGLSISKQIVEKLNGSLTVQSEVGRGSTFVCTLPLQNESGL